MTSTGAKLTIEQFLAMPGNEHCEWIHGEVVEMAENPLDHAMIIMTVGAMIRRFAGEHSLGSVLAESAHYLVTLDDGSQAIRRCDVSFIAQPPDIVRADSPWRGSPDLVIEVVSPSDTYHDIRARTRMWLANGAKAVWLIDHAREVAVHRAGGAVELLGADDGLLGEPELPDFRCRVGAFYD